MVKFFQRVFFILSGLGFSGYIQAQDSLRNVKPEMADSMRSNGKIYVVVVVLLIILAGLYFYLIQVDRRLSRLEKNSK